MPVSEHLVQVYDTEDELIDAVVPYVAAGLDSDDAVLVVATAPHRVAFERELAAMDIGLEKAAAAGTYVTIDAGEMLGYLRDEGAGPSPEDFDVAVGRPIRKLAAGRPVRAYDETVALLWDQGDIEGAVALDEMWNRLHEGESVTLFCGYPELPSATQPAAMQRVCRSRSHVLPSFGEAVPPEDAVLLGTELRPSLQAPRRARALLRSSLKGLGLDEDRIESGVLAASELAANAVLHARTPFRLLVHPRKASIWIAVEDGAPLEDRRQVSGCAPHGLGLIAALALRWGVIPRRTGKIVWAEIPR